MAALRRVSTIGLWIVGVFNLLSAVAGGIGIVVTDGLGMPASWLADSPFTTYLFPGLILLVIIGGTQAFAVATLYRRSALAPVASAVAGFGMIIWIYVEVVILPEYMWLHTVYFVTGVVQVVMVVAVLWAERHEHTVGPDARSVSARANLKP